jgi:hypothetical protein
MIVCKIGGSDAAAGFGFIERYVAALYTHAMSAIEEDERLT